MNAFKNRIASEWAAMTTTRKAVLGVLIVGSLVVLGLLASGTWDPFAVNTATVAPVSK
ncbi:hypothetical protein V6N00_13485 [Tersicoccus sp. MR15.9]|uniref:hypothetical protein n=1 Tax=Tersicoccus mangrovi TaxID=3121635 RepID=UPI002FE67A5D